jgi:hypothetical protein
VWVNILKNETVAEAAVWELRQAYRRIEPRSFDMDGSSVFCHLLAASPSSTPVKASGSKKTPTRSNGLGACYHPPSEASSGLCKSTQTSKNLDHRERIEFAVCEQIPSRLRPLLVGRPRLARPVPRNRGTHPLSDW